MTSGVIVRTLEAPEWTLWRDMRLRALADAPDAFRPVLEEERGQPDSWWAEIIGSTAAHPRGDLWIAWLNGAAVGMLFGRIDPQYSLLEIGAMWVEPQSRRRGVGSALVAVALEWAKGFEVGTALMWCRDDADVKAFYVRQGFESTGEREPLRTGSPMSVVRMRMRI